MGNLVDFTSKDVQFDEYLKQNPYFQMTAINALIHMGYEVTPKGIKEYQRTKYITETGILGITTFSCLVMDAFEADESQQLLREINNYLQTVNTAPPEKEQHSHVSNFITFVIAVLFVACMIVGAIDIAKWFIRLFIH